MPHLVLHAREAGRLVVVGGGQEADVDEDDGQDKHLEAAAVGQAVALPAQAAAGQGLLLRGLEPAGGGGRGGRSWGADLWRGYGDAERKWRN